MLPTNASFARYGRSVDHELTMNEECEKKAADLGFDLTKQFLTLAFGGIAFVVGLSFNNPGVVSRTMLWWIIVTFGLSVLLGLFFLMNGVSQLANKKSFDIYASSLRALSILQILFMLSGTILLGVLLKHRPENKERPQNHIEVKTDSTHSVTVPLNTDRSTTVEVDGNKVRVTTSK